MAHVVVAAVLLLFVAGAAPSPDYDETIAEVLRSIEEELATLDAGPGPGEGGTPGPLAGNWQTDFSKRAVPLSEIQSGGPGKDGIPAIDRPRFLDVDAVDFLKPKEPVIELEVDDDARAYPIQILIWHEIVNDRVGGIP